MLRPLPHCKSRWKDVLQAVDNEVKPSRWHVKVPPLGIYSVDGPKSSAPPTMAFRIDKAWVFAHNDDGKWVAIWEVPDAGTFRDLNSFFGFWDEIRYGKSAYLPTIVTFNERDPTGCTNFKEINSADARRPEYMLQQLDYAVKLIDERNRLWTIEPKVYEERKPGIAYRGDPADYCRFAQFTVVPLPFDMARAFKAVAPQAEHWGRGDSKSNFAELIENSKGLESLNIGSLSLFLRQRANQETDRIELFQAKLPASAIPTYGALILILCQIYLLAHLIELSLILSTTKLSEYPVGYIGVYSNRYVFIFTILSLSIFPIIPIALEILKTNGRVRYFAIAALLASLMLGTLCSSALLKARRILAAQRMLSEEMS
jgi:hypothetical protein